MILPLIIIDEGENSKIQERASSGPGDVPSPSKISPFWGVVRWGRVAPVMMLTPVGPGLQKKKPCQSAYI